MPREVGKAVRLSADEYRTAHGKAHEIVDYLRTLERTPEVDRLMFLSVQLTRALQTDKEKDESRAKIDAVYAREKAREEAGYFDENGNLTEVGERDPLGHFGPAGHLIEPEGPPKYVGAVLTGRGRNGAQRDAGLVVHLIENPGRSWPIFGKALCGRKPGRTSNGWDADGNKTATCKACLKKAAVPQPPPPEPTAERKAVHNPQFRFDCDNCKFSWCCGPCCTCSLDLPMPPKERTDEVNRLYNEWRKERGYLPVINHPNLEPR